MDVCSVRFCVFLCLCVPVRVCVCLTVFSDGLHYSVFFNNEFDLVFFQLFWSLHLFSHWFTTADLL